MNQKHPLLFRTLWMLFVFIIISFIFTAVFYLTNWLFHIWHWHIAPALINLIDAFLSLIITGLIVNIVGHIARKRGWSPESHIFKPIFNALETISTGNFKVLLDNEFPERHMYGELIERVKKMAKDLGEMENMRQEFISNVSHEIQSPLTSIRGFAAALENEHLTPDERKHYLNIIIDESDRLAKLSDNLLKLAALEGETFKLEKREFRLDEQLRRSLLVSEVQWETKKLIVDADLAEVTISADEDKLSQVWLNLITNSIKFTPEGGNIKVELKKDSLNAVVTVRDSGIGISESDQMRLFERFFKADKSRTRSKEGSGLGLSIVKKIIDLHRGKIKVESEWGIGTAFTVTLPLNG